MKTWGDLSLKRRCRLPGADSIRRRRNDGGGLWFPLRFLAEVSDNDHAGRIVVAVYIGADFVKPGILPVYFPRSERQARFARITATWLFRDGSGTLRPRRNDAAARTPQHLCIQRA